MKVVSSFNIQPKPFTRYGRVYTHKTENTLHADVIPGHSIRIYGERTDQGHFDSTTKEFVRDTVYFDRTFKIGDHAEYDSYNLIYTGPIVKIGPKTVTVKHYEHSRVVSRMDLYDFIIRNWDLDLDKISKENADTMMVI